MDQDGVSEGSALAGRYELGALLGRGGMGVVREATDLRLARKVAVKILRPDLADQAMARRRFETEARAAASLSHPYVVTVFDSGEEDGVPFLVMERLPGRTLADELVTGPLPLDRVYEIAREILSALEAAHGAGIIHRDIKPGNVLLAAGGHIKVGDFGIAKTIDDLDQTQTLELVATLGYLAPERLAGEPASQRSDLYSVGVLLYEMISGRRPFAGPSPAAEMLAIERSEPEPIASLRSPLPDALVAVVERSMLRDPALRFDSAIEMAEALGGFADDVVTAPIDPAAAADTVLVELAARDGVTQVLQSPSRLVDPVDASRADGSMARRVVVLGIVAVLVAVIAGGLVIRRDHAQRSPLAPPVTTSPTAVVPKSTNLPAPLDNAIGRLEQDVAN